MYSLLKITVHLVEDEAMGEATLNIELPTLASAPFMARAIVNDDQALESLIVTALMQLRKDQGR